MTAQGQVQYVSDEEGQAVSVIVPIELWHEIASERETDWRLPEKYLITWRSRFDLAPSGLPTVANA